MDSLAIKDEDTVFGCGNNRIVLEFSKQKEKDDKNELCFTRKILIGCGRLIDQKLEKPINYDISLPVCHILIYIINLKIRKMISKLTLVVII